MKILTIVLLITFTFSVNAQNLTDSIRFVNAPYETKFIQSGVAWQHFHFQDSAIFNAKENINLIRVAKNAKGIRWALGTDCDSLLPTSALAKKYNAIAAINGSFFDVKKGGAVDFLKIDNLVVDTSKSNGVKLAEHQQAALILKNNLPCIIHARDSFDYDWQRTFTAYTDVMVSGPWLIQNREINTLSVTPFNKNRHPRSGVCFTDSEIILITVDGRTSDSYGINLSEFAALMRWLGCSDGINLDGGGSTTLYVKGEVENGVVNMPCDNKKFDHQGERAVSNIIMLVPQK